MPLRINIDDADEVVVVRLVNGERVGAPIRPADAAAAVSRMARLGFTDGQIAVRLGMYARSVLRIRKRHGIPGQPVGVNHHTRRYDVATDRRGWKASWWARR